MSIQGSNQITSTRTSHHKISKITATQIHCDGVTLETLQEMLANFSVEIELDAKGLFRHVANMFRQT